MGKLEILKKVAKENQEFFWLYKEIKKLGITYAYKWTLKKKFKDACGYELNLQNPMGFNEKIQWIKVYHHDPLMTRCADKYEVRDYVKQKIGVDCPCKLTKVFGAWENPENIPFDTLPSQFVLKSNHASGQVIIVKNKEHFNKCEAIKRMKKWLQENYYYVTGEWVYKNIKPKIICEELLDDDIKDYKFYCFNGIPKFLYISQGFSKSHDQVCMNYVSLDWVKTPFQRHDYAQFKKLPPCPNNLSEMIKVAETLSRDFPFVRVDLYSIRGGTYFSELTFYPNGGFATFYPMEWEYKIGKWLKL